MTPINLNNITPKDINPQYLLNNRLGKQLVKFIVQNLQSNSVNCTWEQTFRCPCVDIQSNSPKPDCEVCHGQGWVFGQSYILDIGFGSDKNQVYDGVNTQGFLPSTLATPQITQGGIEDGIKPGDRITINNWYVPQSYIFNVTKSRLNGGVFVPYLVKSIDRAYIIKDSQLQSLDIGNDIVLEDNYIKVINNDLLGSTISCLLSIAKRYYVSMLLKDLRYTHQSGADEKKAATGYGNSFITYSQLINGEVQYNGDQVFKMPNQLLLRRETLFFSSSNLVENDTDNNSVISDPRVQSMNSFLGGE